jgi:thioredoxin-dependent peroxiredoxin
MKTRLLSAVLLCSATAVFAAMPKVGEPAPSFAGTDQNGNAITLAGFTDKTNLLLYFYPKAMTSGCTKEACGFRDRLGDLATNNVAVVGVSFDTIAKQKEFAEKFNLNFPLLADTNGVITAAYDVKMPMLKLDKRVSFLIGKDGKILHVTDAMNPQTHFDEMQAAIAELKK